MRTTPSASSWHRSQPPAGTTPSRSFVINNQHCYPVLNRDLLLQTIRTKELELQKYTVDIAYDDYDTLVSEEFDPGVEYKKTSVFDEIKPFHPQVDVFVPGEYEIPTLKLPGGGQLLGGFKPW
eukprot:Hpha_TRINITY_DN16743_c0_g2::TRINITY_DN16743_c0_g2_i4::g.78831::m.78831